MLIKSVSFFDKHFNTACIDVIIHICIVEMYNRGVMSHCMQLSYCWPIIDGLYFGCYGPVRSEGKVLDYSSLDIRAVA